MSDIEDMIRRIVREEIRAMSAERTVPEEGAVLTILRDVPFARAGDVVTVVSDYVGSDGYFETLGPNGWFVYLGALAEGDEWERMT